MKENTEPTTIENPIITYQEYEQQKPKPVRRKRRTEAESLNEYSEYILNKNRRY
jgi:transposase